MSYYSTLTNASMHPLRKAYDQFNSDKQSCIATMNANQLMYKQYVEAEERLKRLNKEQAELLSIMNSDLTVDLCVQKLSG